MNNTKQEPGAPTYTADELYAFIATLTAELKDSMFPKYQRKLFNCYINNSVKAIQNSKLPLQRRFCIMVATIAFGRAAEGTALSPEAPFKEMEDEILQYLCKAEISKIRAVILDLYTYSYTEESSYSVRPEQWAVALVEELKTVLPPNETNKVQVTACDVLRLLESLLLKELKELFISKNKPLGKKGNLLVVNLIYIQKYFTSQSLSPEPIDAFIKTVQKSFKPGEVPEETKRLRELQVQK
ncbi:hypothetical protein NEDG_01964 [Nematocida displodere]|uniref:Uncharacterized protein n=1 Tax=Nematocida displodere TaxID=1805483 RepID=A0A177EHL7_9MICR|nr:hypothetical protein NEDG_01964 [Nematocida displodere]